MGNGLKSILMEEQSYFGTPILSQYIFEEIFLSYEKVGKLEKIFRQNAGVRKNSRAEII